MSAPSSSHETVLLAVVGMSPAILTETVWALAHEPEPVVPDRVIAVTTLTGRQRITDLLLTPSKQLNGQSAWHALRASLEKKGFDLADNLRFGATGNDIRILSTADPATALTRELDDLRTAAENEAAADFLLEQVRGIVENPDTSLIASIAGGRKTMGALLYACLTLIGRETDRLTHVLVNEPFETIPEFFFPDQPGGHVTNRAGEAFAPADARIELADVPFVPLRNLFIRELGQPAGSFQRLVDLCRTRVRRSLAEQLRLELETDRTIARVNDRQLKLNPREYLVFLFFATRAKNEEPAFPAYKDALDPLNEFREARIQEALADIADWRSSDALKARLDEHDLTRLRSDIKKKAIAAGGDAAHLVNVLPEKGRCSLDLPSANITITREK